MAAVSDKLLSVACPWSVVLSGWWRTTTKTGHHDIAEILLKVALKIKKNCLM
jgi:hypothetical protein